MCDRVNVQSVNTLVLQPDLGKLHLVDAETSQRRLTFGPYPFR